MVDCGWSRRLLPAPLLRRCRARRFEVNVTQLPPGEPEERVQTRIDETRATIDAVLSALDDPGTIDPGLAKLVSDNLARLRAHTGGIVRDGLSGDDATSPEDELAARRQPTASWPMSAVEGAPDDQPPVPPAAL